MTISVIVILFIVIILMLGMSLLFKDNLGSVFFTYRNFVASIIAIGIIGISYVVLIFPTPIGIVNQIFSIFSTIPFMLAFFGGGFMLFLGLLVETIILFFIIRLFLTNDKKKTL